MQSTHETIIDSGDGLEIFIHSWAKEKPEAIIVGSHGLGEHSGSYWMLAQGLAQTGIELSVNDHRGHGRSSGKRGVATIDEYVHDYGVVLKNIQAHAGGAPIFLLGHSMGGLVLLKFLIQNAGVDLGIKGAILSSPLFGVALEVPKIKTMAAGMLARLTPNLTLHNEIQYTDLSHDPECVKFHNSDTWRHDRISAKLYLSMVESMDFCFQNADKVKLPLLMQLAGSDLVTSTPKSQEIFQLLKCEKEIKIYEGFYHEIYNEKDRSQPIGDLINWVGRHLRVTRNTTRSLSSSSVS